MDGTITKAPGPAGRFTTDAARWRAVRTRDGSADGAFVYAVATTGIYCRPSCPARRPKRGNVAYPGTPAAAERAGYRPCRRCRPERASAPGPREPA